MNLLEVKQEFFRRLGEMMEGMSIEEEKETISKIKHSWLEEYSEKRHKPYLICRYCGKYWKPEECTIIKGEEGSPGETIYSVVRYICPGCSEEAMVVRKKKS